MGKSVEKMPGDQIGNQDVQHGVTNQIIDKKKTAKIFQPKRLNTAFGPPCLKVAFVSARRLLILEINLERDHHESIIDN